MPYMFEGEGRKIVMVVNKAVRTSLGKANGDTVEFDLERDDRSRSADIEVPPELAAALAADPGREPRPGTPSLPRIAASTPSTSPRRSSPRRACDAREDRGGAPGLAAATRVAPVGATPRGVRRSSRSSRRR